jgi:hypothetical protein
VKRRKEEQRGSSHSRLFPPYNTLHKVTYNSARLCCLWLHSLSEHTSKQENEQKRKAKDRCEEESNSRLEKVRGKAVEHRFLILTTGEATGSGDSQAREEQSPLEFATSLLVPLVSTVTASLLKTSRANDSSVFPVLVAFVLLLSVECTAHIRLCLTGSLPPARRSQRRSPVAVSRGSSVALERREK